MKQSREKTQNMMLFTLDMIAFAVAYVLSGIVWIYFYKGMSDLEVVADILERELGVSIVTYILVIIFFNMNNDFLRRGKFEEFKYVFKINVLYTAVFAVAILVKGSAATLSRGIFVLAPSLNLVIMYILHRVLKSYLGKRSGSTKADKVILITTSSQVNVALRQAQGRELSQMKVDAIALVDVKAQGTQINGIPVVASYADMIEYIKREVVDEALVLLPYDSGASMRELIGELQDMGVVVHLSLDKMEAFNEFNKTLGMFGDIPVITFANRFYDANKLLIKRLIDIVGAIIGIAGTLVVSIFVAPALLIESRGPLIFKQKRVGKNGRYFYIYKFRSMYKDAEERKKELMEKNEMSGLMFKMTDDPRITKVGKFIRKTSIDELPQFFNVLKGDMSLVGTRPPTADEFKQYEIHHKRRLSMKPGITGMWQVSGRSDIDDFEEIVKLDLKYIDNWSLGLDIKIILKTIGVIFTSKGAK